MFRTRRSLPACVCVIGVVVSVFELFGANFPNFRRINDDENVSRNRPRQRGRDVCMEESSIRKLNSATVGLFPGKRIYTYITRTYSPIDGTRAVNTCPYKTYYSRFVDFRCRPAGRYRMSPLSVIYGRYTERTNLPRRDVCEASCVLTVS